LKTGYGWKPVIPRYLIPHLGKGLLRELTTAKVQEMQRLTLLSEDVLRTELRRQVPSNHLVGQRHITDSAERGRSQQSVRQVGPRHWLSVCFGIGISCCCGLIIGLPAGVWVDRSRKRPLMIGCDIVRTVTVGSVPVENMIAFTLPEIRRPLTTLVLRAADTGDHARAWPSGRRQRQHEACASRYKRRGHPLTSLPLQH
jgi:hypothetical protein